MPLEVIESTDPVAQLIRFETSAVHELMMSLHVLLKPERRAAWVREAREALPADFLAALEALYEPYYKGALFFELTVDYDAPHDVPGYFHYVREMDPARFIFYVTGRIVPAEKIAATGLEPNAVREALLSSRYYNHCTCMEVPLDTILADVPAFQRRLTDLWAWYWDVFFADQVPALQARWARCLNDKQALLAREGGMALWEHVTGKPELIEPLPADQPVRVITFIPAYLMAAPVYMFYGYGKITVVFDSERTQARTVEIEQTKELALTVFKALSDGSRLDILRWIAYYEGEMNGKVIAAKTGLSASAVSRHLRQLQDAGLIVEKAGDHRSVTYSVAHEQVGALSDLLFAFLRS